MVTLAPHTIEGLEVIHSPGRPNPQLVRAPVSAHERVSPRHWALTVQAPEIAKVALPGQFLMATVEPGGDTAQTLPRPMAIARADGDAVEFVYGVAGRGTERLTRTAVGDVTTVVGPLGQPFTLADETTSLLVLGRGIGSCSLTTLVDLAASRGVAVTALDSARSDDLLVGARYFERSGARTLRVDDVSGSSSVTHVEELVREACRGTLPQQIATCGSTRLVRLAERLGAEWHARLEVSIEAHMACGIGYCHGCARGTQSATAESPLVCKDGPVFHLPHLKE